MRILVVDDDEISRTLLSRSLMHLGYDVVTADGGEAALEILAGDNVCVMVADWMMPGMDGIELCRRVRSTGAMQHIYIILLTARQDRKSMLTGFEAGIDEFLQKPCDIDELDAHVKVGIRIVNLERGLMAEQEKVQRYAQEMEELAAERARQLLHADRMASIGRLASGVAHEVNNPTSFISGNAQTLLEYLPYIERALSAVPDTSPESAQIRFIQKELLPVVEGIKTGAQRISRIVSGLKSFVHQSKAHISDVSVDEEIETALTLCRNALRHLMGIRKEYAAKGAYVKADPQLLSQVLVNLFTNAADAMEHMEDGVLTLSTTQSGRTVSIEISDNGPGLPSEIIEKIFTPFFTTKPVGKGTGLGLSVSLGIIEEMDGTLEAENGKQGGALFRITLPAV